MLWSPQIITLLTFSLLIYPENLTKALPYRRHYLPRTSVTSLIRPFAMGWWLEAWQDLKAFSILKAEICYRSALCKLDPG